MAIANLLAVLGIVAEAAVIAVMAWRHAYRRLPVFFLYIAWGVSGDLAILILRMLARGENLRVFEIQIYIDSVFQYLVLIELAWSTLRPMRRSLPGGFLIGVSLAIAAAAVLAWPLTEIQGSARYPLQFLFALHAQRVFAMVRILFFLVLSGLSQLLQIGWRDRELQVATGLGFYSLVSLAGAMVHSHQSYGMQYFYVDVTIACSYLLSLIYWIYSFAQAEAARREMTPEMRRFLLGMAEVLRQQRSWISASRR